MLIQSRKNHLGQNSDQCLANLPNATDNNAFKFHKELDNSVAGAYGGRTTTTEEFTWSIGILYVNQGEEGVLGHAKQLT